MRLLRSLVGLSLACVAAAALAGILAPEPPRASACAIVPPEPDIAVAMQHEEAAIVWDADAKIEHFIRRASFETSAGDFGFLVPTPTQPTLHEADDALFDRLIDTTRRVRSTEAHFVPENLSLLLSIFVMSMGAGRGADPDLLGQVRVLESTTVAGYKAAVLEADRADALALWLRDNGYPSRPALEEWLVPYVASGYVITAFKVAAPAGATGTAAPDRTLGAVRLSFATERPFYPYREPSDTIASPSRALRVFFVGPGPALARLCEATPTAASGAASTHWSARIRYERPFEASRACPPLAGLQATTPTAGTTWLTEFVDRSTRRPAGDVFFDRDSSPAEVVPTEVVNLRIPPFPIPTEVIIPAAIFIWLRRRRARATRSL